MTKRRPDLKNGEGEQAGFGGGVFDSLTGFLNNLGDLAEAGREARSRSGFPSGERPGGPWKRGKDVRREPFQPIPYRFDGHR